MAVAADTYGAAAASAWDEVAQVERLRKILEALAMDHRCWVLEDAVEEGDLVLPGLVAFCPVS